MLDDNTQELLKIVMACSPEKLAYHKPNTWSILQILEHITIADTIVFFLLREPSEATSDSGEIYGNEKLKKIVVDFRTRKKVEAPVSLQPQGKFTEISAFEKTFLRGRNLLKHDLASGKIKVSNSTHKHPYLGEMTISDWLNFILHHTQRHMEQIKENLLDFETETSPPVE